jgi:uncharacterized membrane protein
MNELNQNGNSELYINSFVSNKQLMTKARASLKGKWGISIAVFVIFFLVSIAFGIIPILGGVAQILIEGPLCLGLYFFALNLIRGKEIGLSQLFDGFRVFGKALGSFMLMIVFILLWSLLFIIPGIIAAFSYSMIFFIIADDRNIGQLEALRKSKELMMGNKWKLFCLSWRFFWWFLLCMLTFGIGFIWLNPYILITKAHFYEAIK